LRNIANKRDQEILESNSKHETALIEKENKEI
jgi:hypothetical protein